MHEMTILRRLRGGGRACSFAAVSPAQSSPAPDAPSSGLVEDMDVSPSQLATRQIATDRNRMLKRTAGACCKSRILRSRPSTLSLAALVCMMSRSGIGNHAVSRCRGGLDNGPMSPRFAALPSPHRGRGRAVNSRLLLAPFSVIAGTGRTGCDSGRTWNSEQR